MTPYEHLRIAIWVFGVPTIIVLTIRAIRKMRAIRQRHEELLAEAERNPQDPYKSLAELYNDRQRN